MIVDDDPLILNILGNGLQQKGYRVSAYESPLEALENYKKFPPDIAIVDIEMPEMNGIELSDHMLRTVYRPILVLSSRADKEVTNAAIESGVVGYHVKPVAAEQMIPAIRTAVARFAGMNESVIGQFLGREQASESVTLQIILDQFPFGVLIIDRGRTLLHINRNARDILQDCEYIRCEGGQFVVKEGSFADAVDDVLSAAFATSDAAETFGTPLPRQEGIRHYQVVALPLGESRPADNVLIMVIDPNHEKSANTRVLRAVYNLTEKECSVAEALVRGSTLDEYCKNNFVSKNTARTQLKAVYRKTNTTSQVALVSLLSKLLFSLGH